MAASPKKFAGLLSQAIRIIVARGRKKVAAVQDELGYALGRGGGSAIEFWRKGHVPTDLGDVEKLAEELYRRQGLSDVKELEAFLASGGHTSPKSLAEDIADRPKEDTPKPPSLDPFVVGVPISYPRQFFGRKDELTYLFGLWKRYPMQSAVLIGAQRSGKTSLLRYLEKITKTPAAQLRPGQPTDWLPHPDDYRWIFVDFQDARYCERRWLLAYLSNRLGLESQPCDLGSFIEEVSEHLRTPTLILMDEIGAALASRELDQRFWWSLRSLASNSDGNLGFVLTSTGHPQQLAHDLGKPSPFFNIFHTVTLRPLDESEARELIASSPRPFAEADVEWILAQSGLWPALLQIICFERLRALETGETGEIWKRRALEKVAPYRHLLNSR